MADSARVHDSEALKLARSALSQFAEQVSGALASVDADIERVSQWLRVDRQTHWKLEVRRRVEAVERGKAEIMRKRIIAAPDPASVALEERQLDRARQRLDDARLKLDRVQRWVPTWEREAMLYKTSTRQLSEYLNADVPRALAILSRMMESLEAYTAVAPPPGEGNGPALPAEGEGPAPGPVTDQPPGEERPL
jgi:hypothetical protein